MKTKKDYELNHYDEQIIALYILNAPEVKLQRKEIARHLKKCLGCTALYKDVSEYYREFRALHGKKQSEILPVLAPRRALESFTFTHEVPVPPRHTLLERFVNSLRQYPLRWSAGFAMATTAILFLVQYPAKNVNPAYARAKEEFLLVYNSEGKELWRKHIGMGYDFEGMHRTNPYISLENHLTTVDVNGDGTKEIIALFGWASKRLSEKPNAIVCYRNDGSELWRYEFHRQMIFGDEQFQDEYLITKMIVADFEENGTLEIAAIASHFPFYPLALFRLNAETGDLLDEYWHSGLGDEIIKADADRDGFDDLILGGANNGFNQASFVVLDPRRINGHSPAPQPYVPINVEPGKEKYYLLLPRTDVNQAGAEKRNSVYYIRTTPEGLLEIGTQESQAIEPSPGIIYYFDSTMQCVRVTGNDHFEETHRKMEAKGIITRPLNEQYYEELRRGVRYWDGEKFVKEPVMNGGYKVLSNK